MRRKRSTTKQKSNFLLWLIASLITSTLISACFYMLVGEYLKSGTLSVEVFVNYFSLGLGILLFIIFVLFSALMEKRPSNGNQELEMINFRTFTDDLQKCPSDLEIYQTLQKFISQMPQVTHATLHYNADKMPHSQDWKKITNERLPICSMTPRSCPIIRSHKECIVGSIEKDITCACQYPEYRNGCYMCLPIADSDRVQSVLQVYSNMEYTFDNLAIQKIKSYIDITNSVISSKKALTVLNKKASTDKLTKLYNRSFLDPYLENQLEAANLTGQPLSVIMVDIDHFKSINDTYGHAAGDHVLVLFSEVLMKCIRGTDLVARFGGEEFVIVLPSTRIETAASIAERIRQTTASTIIPPLDGIYIPQITCSLGISVYPDSSTSRHDLIKTADSALYKAKQSGRNCIKIYG